ncbi:hypothetical protein JW968_00790 [Candidatus Woesearchaeota archaeon]|nr:hypothetical protein [Candidatus Woesearchaeota archaeon]
MRVIKDIMKHADNIFATTEKNLKDLDVEKASGEELWRCFNEFYQLGIEMFISGNIPMILDAWEPFFSNYLLDYLKSVAGDNAGEVFSVLCTPEGKTVVAEEEIAFLEMCKKIFSPESTKFLKDNPKIGHFKESFPEEFKLLEAHHAEYHWIPHDFLGALWGMEYFYEKLLTLASSSQKPEQFLAEIRKKDEQVEKKKRECIEKYIIDEKHQKLFKIAQGFLYTKPYRKERFTHSFYYIYKIYKEICRRYDYSLDQSRWMLPEERRELFLNNKMVDKMELEKRNMGCVMVSRNGKNSFEYGKQAKAYIIQIEQHEMPDSDEIKGMCACPGIATGIVKLIFFPEDMSKMEQGNILVSPATNPDVVPAMKKAAAIITDAGGVTSHAAIVSRELNVPCIIGTKIATKVLKDEDLVEVDAVKGIVRKL